MLRSKKDVDRHVRELLNKVKGEDERKVRGYFIARLYFNVNEYESARRYLSEFLTVRPKAMDAHRFLGQIYEGLGNKEKAVICYKTSYELGEGQKDLILKICELYTDVQADSSVRLYWAEEGHRLYPHHENVVKLREALLTGTGSHSREELEKLYLDEIKASPTVVRLQTNLLQLYKDWGAEDKNKLNEAYNYGCQVEARKAFSDSLEWYQVLYDVMQTYQNTTDVSNDVEFHTNYLSTLERLVYLTLASSSGTALLSQCTLTDAARLLHRFDQSLPPSLGIIGQNSQFGQLMVGQLYFHMAVFLMHSAKKDGLTHTSITAGALLFHACRIRAPDSGHQCKSWTSRDQFWYKLACHRLSQAAHVLHHMAKTEAEKTKFLNQVKQQCSNREAQESIYQMLFGTSSANKKDQSFFLRDEEFISSPLAYPESEQVREWDNVVGSMYCASLGDMVWLCLQQGSGSLTTPQPYYVFTLFEGLQFSTTNVNTGAPETLCHIDLLAFLAATVYCQIAASKEAHGPPPASLPTVVASALNTPEQAEWWSAAYTLFTNRAHHRLGKLRMTLQRGLEVIRALGNHGVDLALMAHLAQCFTTWASAAVDDGSTNSEIDALKDRAEHYWHRVLTLCQRAARNVINIMPRNPLFVVQSVSLASEEREKLEEEGKYFLAMRLVHAGKQQEAIQALGELKSPEASFQRAMLYKERAQAVLGEGSLESVTSEMRSQHTILLTQARDTLYLTLDRLRMPGVDRFHPLNTKLSQQLEDVERRLSHINLDQEMAVQREDDTESLSDASQSPRPDITNGHITNMSQTPQIFSTPYRDNRNSTRIARQEARPSPERLDAQVRALSDVQENTLRNMEEQNAALRAQNEALRNLCTTMADEFKENSSLYRSMLEQNKTLSQEAYTSILSEMKHMHSTIKDLQTQMHAMALDLGELQALKSSAKHSEVAEIKAAEEQVPVDLPAAAVVHPGLYPSYMSYYNGQQPVPSPLMPTQGIFGNPPFFPPSTVPEQSYSVSQEPSASSLAQVSTAIVTSTLGSPASITIKEPLPSPSNISAAQSLRDSSLGNLGLNVATTVTTATIAGSSSSHLSDNSAPPHAFQITMPIVSNTLTPPPRSIPGEPLSLPLPCSTTAGLLANVPPPLYSAVTPDSSPVRGESHAQSVSTVLSTEGLSTPTESLVAPSAAAGSQDSTLKFMGAFKSPAGRTLPKISPIKSKESVDEDNDCYVEDDHDPCPDFKPVVPLPEKVEVLTGEEDEEVMFEERAKLYRFVEKEWRERGTGVMKILHNPSQGSARVLMRRDQTHKICANHLIASSIELQPMKSNDKIWVWAAQDFADEEIRMEKFCCRFKTAEIASNFRDAFLKAKNIAKEKETASKEQQDGTESSKEAADELPATPKQSSLAEMFKPAAGSWTCQTCLVVNTGEKMKCAACETPNPSASKAEEPVAGSQTPYASFKFTPTNKTDGAAVAFPVNFQFVGTSSSPSVSKTTLTNTPTTTSGFSFIFGLGTTSTTSSQSVSTVSSCNTTNSAAAVTSQVSSTTSSVSTTTSDASKEVGWFSLSGFTFTTTPSLKQENVDEPQQESQEEEKKKESIFAGFSFGSGTANPPASGFTFSTPSADTKKDGDHTGTTVANSGSLFGSKAASGPLLSFRSLGTDTSSPTNLFTTKNTKAFEPTTVFEKSSPAKSPTKEDGEDKVEEYEPQVDFQPVVPMPDLVEVKTGEEEEEKLFCERAKLFRYDKETKEWKERGVGELKILKNIASGKVRVLMRREQILKVCANHFITPEIKLTPMLSSDKAWIWAAPDFADEEVKEEQFAAKFKTQELALSFKAAFEKAQKSQNTSSSVDLTTNVPESSTQGSFSCLAAMFKPAVGSWECETCLVRNAAESSVCVSCSANKPGYEPPRESTPKYGSSVNVTERNEKECGGDQEKKNDTVPLSLAGMFKPPAGSWECNSCLVRNKAEVTKCIACGSCGNESSVENKSFSLGIRKNEGTSVALSSSAGGFSFGTSDNKPFSFGIPQTSQVTTGTASHPPFTFGVANRSSQETVASDAAPAFSFCVPSDHSNKPFSFAWNPTNTAANLVSSTSSSTSTNTSAFSSAVFSAAPEASSTGSEEDTSTPVKDGKSGFVFGSPGKYEFTFAGIKAKSPRSRDISVCESEDGVLEEDEGDHLYFEPVIPLPDKVEVVTGEEEEDVLYTHRAKLFRLVAGEWKERGLGDVKILAHKQTGKIRLLMRREQVHKICLNHYLKKDMEFHKKDDKNFYWAALDYSEATPQNETFAIRFKTPEIASEFIKEVDIAKVKLGGIHAKPSGMTSSPLELEDDQKDKSPVTVATSNSSAPTTSDSVSVAVVAPADSITPSKTIGVHFGGTSGKLIFGGSPGTVFGASVTPVSSIFGGTVTSSTSVFGGTTTSSASVFGGSSLFGSPTFTVNVSSNFSLKTPANLGINTVSTASHGSGESSLFGGGTTASTTTRSSFSFGDKFSSEPESTDSIEILYEKKATPEQIERARKHQLPDNFYLYEDAPPCPGCRGCEDDEKILKEGQETVPESTSSSSGITFKPTIFGSSGGTSFSSNVIGKFPSSSTSLFGGSSSNNSSNLFGKNTTNTSSVFGSSSSSHNFSSGSTPSTSTSIFGNSTIACTSVSTFGNNAPTSTTNLFGSNSISGSSSIFGGTSSSTALFSPKLMDSARLISTSFSATTVTSTENTTTGSTTKTASEDDLFSSVNNSSQLSFADLAAQASTTNFGQTNQAASAVWATRGQPVFSKSPKKLGEEEGGADDADTHDPHFEPIVPLPDLVEVKTGEEELEVIFSNRGKLYRYDTSSKEWKERGIGDFKILYDRVNNKYRLLQRRELVHKTCCNHYLTPNLELRPLQTSETAWCWYATDYSDNLQGTSERLAIRFKNVDLAKEFKRKFEECQEKLRNVEANASMTTSTSVTVVISQPSHTAHKEDQEDREADNEDENCYDEEEEEEEDDDDDDEEEEEEEEDEEDEDDEEEDGEDNVEIFNKRCTLLKKENGSWKTLGMGDLRIKYDGDIYGARITMTSDSGEILAEHIIAIQTTMHKDGNAATWTVLNLKPEPSVTSTFKANFSSSQALEEFSSAFVEGKEYAENAGIMEQLSGACGEVAPEELYYGQGADEQGLSKEQLTSYSGKGWIAKKALPFSIHQLKTCDPNLTLDIAAALPEFISTQNLECQEE